MRFVRTPLLSGELRGQRIADRLGVPCEEQLTDAKAGEWVVFVKTWEGIKEAKAAGCLIAFDPVDFFSYPGRDQTPTFEVDLLIIPAKSVAGEYRALFPRADFCVIPHQWDDRITGQAQHDEFRPGYVGQAFNLRETLGIPMREDLASLSEFNCHVADYSSHLKPATKISCAAAVGANVVTRPTAPVVELLGEYPFYAHGTLFDTLWRARKAFGTQEWIDAAEIMAEAKKRTSIEAVCERYEVFK